MAPSRIPVRTIASRNRALLGLLGACALLMASVASPVLGGSDPSNGPIAFVRFVNDEAHLMLIEADGSGERELLLPTQGFHPNWSPDGRRLVVGAFAGDTLRPMLVDPARGTTVTLEVPEAPTDLALLCRTWTPDGRRLVCQGDSFSATHPESNGVYSIRTDGSHLKRLTWDAFPPVFGDEGTCGGGDMPGSVSPDGSRFVFTRLRCGTLPAPDRDQEAALFVARMDGSALRRVTPYGLPWSHEEGLARWSPDGSRILFATADGRLAMIRPDGSRRRILALDAPGDNPFVIAPDWSPDGSRIVFDLFQDGAPSGIHVADADGDDVTLLVPIDPDFVNDPDWGAAAR